MNGAELEDLVDHGGRCADPERIKSVAALFNLTLASSDQIGQARDLAARLISPEVAPVELLEAVQAVTGASQFVHENNGRVDGALGFFPVRAAGERQLEADRFDAREFPLDLVARPGEPPAGIYAFGVVASTKQAGSAVIRASAAIQEGLFWALPVYTRIATEDGARVLLGPLGFSRVAPESSLARRAPRSYALEGFRAGVAA